MHGWTEQDLQQLLQSIVEREINFDADPQLREFEIRYGQRTPIRVQGASSGAIHYALLYHLEWDELTLDVLDPHIPDLLVKAIEASGIPVPELARPLGIHPDRLNNAGAGELVKLATEDDDPVWLAGQLIGYLHNKGIDASLPGPINDLRLACLNEV